jgi:MOSC domain-containing protein YiiM
MPQIVSIQIGQPTNYLDTRAADGRERGWTTAFFKLPIAGRVFAGRTNLAGDAQADLEHHGGPDKAVLAYSADHYPYWREQLGIRDLPFGAFGENLSIAGLDETAACIGDRWQAGSVVFEVSQPRQPCWKMSRRWQIEDLAHQVLANGKSGWYLRVLAEGYIESGMELELVSRPHPEWTVARASRVMHHEKGDLAAAAELGALSELAVSWKTVLNDRVKRRA